MQFGNDGEVTAPQQLEGFDELISPTFGDQMAGHWLGPDFRGKSEAGTTPEWWRGRAPDDVDLEWRTAAVPRAVDTIFSFVGESPNIPEWQAHPHRAQLFADEVPVLAFDIGTRRRAAWSEGDWSLEFSPRQVHNSLDEHERQVFSGVSGIYRLSSPASALTPGCPLALKVVVESPTPGAIVWFAVRARTDVLDVSATTNAEQIEQLQQEVIRLKGIVAGLARRGNEELIAEQLDTEDVIVYADGRVHVHEADMIQLHNGELLCAMREAGEHISADGRIITVRSVDGGRSWGDRQLVLEDADTDWRSASLCQLRDGTLLNNALPQTQYDPSGRFVGGHEPVPGHRGRTDGIYVGRSADDGRTWSWPTQPISPDPYRSPWTAERIVELDTGRLVMACYVSAPDETRSISILYASDDGGHNWRFLSVIADVPGVSLNEPSLLQTRSGRLISVLRSNNRRGFYQAVSDDRGESWSPAVPCGIPGEGNPASLVQLPDDIILCVHGSRIDVVGMYVVASSNDGDSWDVTNRKVIRDDLANWDMSYPSTTVMPDGRIFTVYYFNMFHRFFMMGSFFRWET